MESKNSFFRGMLTGIFLVMFLLWIYIILSKFFGIHLFTSSSLADDIRERARVVEAYIDKFYWKDDTPDQTISEYAAKGMVAALGDRYSFYYTPQEFRESMDDIQGDYAGIGASVAIDQKTKEKKIVRLAEGEPAEKAGLQVGDVLRKVDGQDVTNLDLSETVALLRGQSGKKFILTVRRKENGASVDREIAVVTQRIVTKSVSHKMLEDGIGYLAMSTFNKETVKQFEQALDDLEKKKQRGLIIDLRDNGGGSLTACVDMMDRILPKGKLLIEKSREKPDKQYMSSDKQHFDKPVFILINEGSASASEVFAGCMQDRRAATLIGTKSYGKGVVQTIYSLENSCGGGIKLTTGEYLLPSGRCIQDVGLTPDVEVKYTGSSKKWGEKDDNQLLKAREIMKKKIES